MDYPVFFLSPGDVDACLALHGRIVPAFLGMDADTLRQQLALHIEAGRAVCAKTEDGVLGILLFNRAAPAVALLVVDPALRDKTVAADMLDFMTAHYPSLKALPDVLALYHAPATASGWCHRAVMGPEGRFVPDIGLPPGV